MNVSSVPLSKLAWSSIGRKLITGVTGLALILFIVGHLAGNLLLLMPTGELFNIYAHKLASLGVLLYVIEAGLTLFFLTHAYTGIQIARNKAKARPVKYEVYKTQGGKSKQNISSRSMIVTGIVLLVFLVLHLLHFKYGVYHYTEIEGIGKVRDLYKTVVDYFANPLNVAFYVAVMILLGSHLRHGFWSALQSLGAMKPKFSNSIYGFGVILGFVISVGFLVIPIWLYVNQIM